MIGIHLTAREKEIIKNLARGQTVEDIAYLLRLNEGTVEIYLKNILRKMEVDSTALAVALAIKHKMI